MIIFTEKAKTHIKKHNTLKHIAYILTTNTHERLLPEGPQKKKKGVRYPGRCAESEANRSDGNDLNAYDYDNKTESGWRQCSQPDRRYTHVNSQNHDLVGSDLVANDDECSET